MAFTQADLDALDAAIASGELSVGYGDRRVTYRSLDELLRAREIMARALGLTTAAPRRVLSHSKGLDGEGSPTDRWV
jgi:hypothetical protein